MLPSRPALLCVNPDPSTSRLLETAAPHWGFSLYNLNGHLIEQGGHHAGTPAAILFDTTSLNGETGAIIRQMKSRWPASPIVAVVNGDMARPAEFCIQSGIYDYVEKPVDADRLHLTLRRAYEHSRLSAAMDHPEQARAEADSTPDSTPPASTPRDSVPKFDEVERELIIQAIRVCRGNVPDIAHCTGISEATIYRKIRKYELAPLLRRSRHEEATV